MIPIQASYRTRETYVHNIIRTFQSATPGRLQAGRNWYPQAHEIARIITNDGDVVKGAGVIAALSPQTSWWMNVELATDAFENRVAGRHVRDACRKANRIMAGEDPRTILPMRRKTGQFYLCISDPSDTEPVCVDRHAHDVAVGRAFGGAGRGLGAHGRYSLIAECYREAGHRLGEVPSVVQAVTWVVWRDALAGVGTRGEMA
jgi:hypothetical protein